MVKIETIDEIVRFNLNEFNLIILLEGNKTIGEISSNACTFYPGPDGSAGEEEHEGVV